jgi:hypothetical protein
MHLPSQIMFNIINIKFKPIYFSDFYKSVLTIYLISANRQQPVLTGIEQHCLLDTSKFMGALSVRLGNDPRQKKQGANFPPLI